MNNSPAQTRETEKTMNANPPQIPGIPVNRAAIEYTRIISQPTSHSPAAFVRVCLATEANANINNTMQAKSGIRVQIT